MRTIRDRLPPVAISSLRKGQAILLPTRVLSVTTLELQSAPGPPNYAFSPRFRNPEADEGPKCRRVSNAQRRPCLLISNAHSGFNCFDVSARANSTAAWRIPHSPYLPDCSVHAWHTNLACRRGTVLLMTSQLIDRTASVLWQAKHKYNDYARWALQRVAYRDLSSYYKNRPDAKRSLPITVRRSTLAIFIILSISLIPNLGIAHLR
jgi:hypothetical protein